MKTAVIGLGLIGGSMAKAFKDNTDSEVFGLDINESVMLKAKLVGAIDEELTDGILAQCDRIILALYPESTVEFLRSKADIIKKGAVVIDCSGVKRYVFTPAHELAKAHGFEFIGGHPMAGTERSGFENSFGDLFAGASMILCPEYCDDEKALKTVSDFFLEIGFGRITLSSCAHHDEVIAFTSQLAHVVSSAYIHGRLSTEYSGFSAGSFADMTRVARLSADMWTELFFENGANLSDAIGELIDNLQKYKTALDTGDRAAMHTLLAEGNARKIESEKLSTPKEGTKTC